MLEVFLEQVAAETTILELVAEETTILELVAAEAAIWKVVAAEATIWKVVAAEATSLAAKELPKQILAEIYFFITWIFFCPPFKKNVELK